MLNKAYILCMIFFFIIRNNVYVSDISRITYALLSSSKLHWILLLQLTADNLIGGIDRRIHAKTPDIFEILSTVHQSGTQHGL